MKTFTSISSFIITVFSIAAFALGVAGLFVAEYEKATVLLLIAIFLELLVIPRAHY